MKVIRQGKTSPRQKCRGFCFRGGGRDAFPRRPGRRADAVVGRTRRRRAPTRRFAGRDAFPMRPLRRADAVVVRCVRRADASETRPYQDAPLPRRVPTDYDIIIA